MKKWAFDRKLRDNFCQINVILDHTNGYNWRLGAIDG